MNKKDKLEQIEIIDNGKIIAFLTPLYVNKQAEIVKQKTKEFFQRAEKTSNTNLHQEFIKELEYNLREANFNAGKEEDIICQRTIKVGDKFYIRNNFITIKDGIITAIDEKYPSELR